jgi:hypothetical protein
VVGLNTSSQSENVDLVHALQPLPNREALVGGAFKQVDGQSQPFLARLGADGRLRPKFRPELKGTSVYELGLLPSAGVLVRGAITNVDGRTVGGLFKLHLPEDLPPVAQILFPTNGAHFVFGDGLPPFQISARAYDPDGFLKSATLILDGVTILQTNSVQIEYLDFPPTSPYSEGTHRIDIVAEDMDGLRTTNGISYTARSIPFPGPLGLTKGPNNTISISGIWGILEESEDLRSWNAVPGTENPRIIVADRSRRYYRCRQ